MSCRVREFRMKDSDVAVKDAIENRCIFVKKGGKDVDFIECFDDWSAW
ncbi:hypothetical protein KAW50_01300 [candidate division WOR-3 bacterium]|nr:hypothetical protein [candidate division WOR-3 bacterium]